MLSFKIKLKSLKTVLIFLWKKSLIQKADLLLMDERKERMVAKQMGLTITGTVGILLQSFDEGLLNADEIRESINKLKECGIRISDSLYDLVLEHIQEK